MPQQAGHGDPMRAALLRLLSAEPDDAAGLATVLDNIIHRSQERGGDAAMPLDALTRAAGQHGVLGLLDAALARLPDVPAGVREASQRRRTAAELWHSHLLEAVGEAVRALDTQGVAVLALKGPVLAARVYPPHVTRHSMDLDLLVRETDLEAASQALAAIGYVRETGPAADYLRRHGHHVHLAKPGLPPIELHFCTYAGFGVVLPSAAVLDRAVPFQLPSGVNILVPSPEDEVAYLATHAAGHSFIRLMWLYDLKLLLRKPPSIDWTAVATRASALGVETPVAYAMRLLRLWFAVETSGLPDSLLRHRARSRMADWLLNEVSTPQPSSARDNVGGLLFTSLLCDRLTSGVGLVQHHALRSIRRRLKRHVRALPDAWSG